MTKPMEERGNSGKSAQPVLKQMHCDILKLRMEGRDKLAELNQTSSFADVLEACQNLCKIQQQQTAELQEYLVQYGYQPPVQNKPKIVVTDKKKKKNDDEDKENQVIAKQDMQEDAHPVTPPPSEKPSSADLQKTPKMEDYCLSQRRLNQFIKGGSTSSGLPPVQSGPAISSSSLRTNASYALTSTNLPYKAHGNGMKTESSTSLSSSSASIKDQVGHPSVTLSEQGSNSQGPVGASVPWQTFGGINNPPYDPFQEPEAPALTSWFEIRIPAPPKISHLSQNATETSTPPAPEVTTTNVFASMPQEPKCFTNIDAFEPKPPSQTTQLYRSTTPVEPEKLTEVDDSTPVKPQTQYLDKTVEGFHTPVSQKGSWFHGKHLDETATPQTPEMTMNFTSFNMQSNIQLPSQAFMDHDPSRSFDNPSGHEMVQELPSIQTAGFQSFTPVMNSYNGGQSLPPPRAGYVALEQTVTSMSHDTMNTYDIRPMGDKNTLRTSHGAYCAPSINSNSCAKIVPLTGNEIQTLPEEMRRLITLERANTYIQKINAILESNPVDKPYLTQEDLGAQNLGPFAKCIILFLLRFQRLQKGQLAGSGHTVFFPVDKL